MRSTSISRRVCSRCFTSLLPNLLLRLLAHRVAAGALGPVKSLVGGVSELVACRAVLGVGGDADGEGRVGEGALVLEGVLLDAASDLLGYGQRLLPVEFGQDGLVLVAAEAGRPAASLLVQFPDNAADRADDELAQEVAVAVVDLLEIVYVRHEDAQGFAQCYRRLQVVLELLVKALLGQETGQVVAVDQVVQGRVELRLYGIPLRELQHRVAHYDAISVA